MKVDTIYNKSCLDMKEIDDESVHLVVTSPPYNVDIPYNTYHDKRPREEWLDMIEKFMRECMRVLVDGGRICINVANVDRNPYVRNTYDIPRIAYKVGFKDKADIIWNKGEGVARGKSSWGSFCSYTNPCTRDCHEYIMIFCKNSWKMELQEVKYPKDITSKEFADFSVSVWNVVPSGMGEKNDNNEWHPAKFPYEIPYRLIKLFTGKRMVVLDPFAGSGTTLIAAKKTGRHYIGYEIDEMYVEKIRYALGLDIYDPGEF